MKRDILRSIIIVGLIITLGISSTYAFMYYSNSNASSTGNGGCFVVTYQGTAVTNATITVGETYNETGANAHPVVKLSKNANCKIYTTASIYLSVDQTSGIPLEISNPASGAFKYKIMNGSTEVASGVVQKSNSDILLATVNLTTSTVTYVIYLWIDINLSIGEYNGKTFSGKIYAKSDQSSTIS